MKIWGLLFTTIIGDILGELVIYVHKKIREISLYHKNNKIYPFFNINDNFLMNNLKDKKHYNHTYIYPLGLYIGERYLN
jgi:hypothetical protein